MPNPHNPDTSERQFPMIHPLVFDIETGPRSEVVSTPSAWFKPDSRLKDPAKIQASIAEQADDGALSPVTGEVLAIGYGDMNGKFWCDFASDIGEAGVISSFLLQAADRINRGCRVVGFNILDFDVPFLLFRAAALGVTIPACIGNTWRGRWQPSEMFSDLMLLAQFGNHNRKGYSLDRVCRAMGIEGKAITGQFFHQMLRDSQEDAKQYLTNDIRCTVELARKLL